MQRHAKGPHSSARGRSKTSDILGNTAQNGDFNRKWAQHYRMLTMLRERFARELQIQSETAREGVSNHAESIADAATDSYDRDYALAMVSSSQTLLYEIEQAMSRINKGTYGVCEATGKSIEKERLIAVPWTRFTAEAQNELELRGSVHRPRLGEVGSVLKTAESEEAEGELEEAGELKKSEVRSSKSEF
jgi:RNA polymerase-binding transcription factor DksA